MHSQRERYQFLGRVIFPWVTEKLLMQKVRRMLWNSNLVSSSVELPVWYWLAHKTYRDLLDNGAAHALATAQAIRDTYLTEGYSGETAARVVLLVLGVQI